jgi:multidrug efflux pump subunit AcrA (membrane-fusion protein)
VVTRRHTGMGRPVREGEPLFRVTALQPLKAVARLPERDARGLRRGTVAALLDDAGGEIRAVISRIAPAVEPGSGTVEVLFDVPRPGTLLPGSSATVRLDRAGGVRPPQ